MSAADCWLPRRQEAFHERYPDPIRSIVARRAYAAHGTRARDRDLVRRRVCNRSDAQPRRSPLTQNVYDSPTGRILVIPQGSRLIGDYEADVAFGQSRILLAWNRLILPDGRSIVLERQPASDPRGFAGLQDGTNYHWGGVLKAALVSMLMGVGSELGAGNGSDLTRAIRRGTQDSINRAGEQIVSRELNVRPSLTIRPGFPVRVLVTRDLVLGGE